MGGYFTKHELRAMIRPPDQLQCVPQPTPVRAVMQCVTVRRVACGARRESECRLMLEARHGPALSHEWLLRNPHLRDHLTRLLHALGDRTDGLSLYSALFEDAAERDGV